MQGLTDEVWNVDAGDFPRSGTPQDQATFLIRYAVLAPSSHNTQPWMFRVDGHRIDLFADLTGWLRVADADRRELFLSLGCALENLIIAAEHFGLGPSVRYVGEGDEGRLVASVTIEEGEPDSGSTRPPRLFEAIPRRRTNHGKYDGRAVPEHVRTELEGLASEEGIGIHLTEDVQVRRRVDELTVRADALQFADPEWRAELGEWMGRGVFGTGWLMSKITRLAVSHLDMGESTGKKDSELLQSASLLGLISVADVSRASRVRAGQVLERLWLAATDAGLALHPMNQILQVPEVREQFEELLPREWGTPQVTFRIGYAEPEEHTPRRSVGEVLVHEGNGVS